MKTTIINPEGYWDFWEETLLNELEVLQSNSNEGEKIVFENDKFRIWSIALAIAQSLPFHKHCLPYVWTAVTQGNARSY